MVFLRSLIGRLIMLIFTLRYFFTKAAVYEDACKKTHRWYRLKLPGAKAADGSPFSVYVKKGMANKLIIYFAGGGASWNGQTAAAPMSFQTIIEGKEGYYFSRLDNYQELFINGILGKDDRRNPFNEWNYIYLPYSTADFYVGNNEFPYTGTDGKRHILYHKGVENMRRALESIPPEFCRPESLFIIGESAGAFGVVANAGEVAAFFPECQDITVYADGSHIEYPGWKGIIRDVWKAAEDKYACVGEDGMLIRDWFIRLGKQLPGAALLQSNSAFDETLSQFQNKLNHDQYTVTLQALEEFHRGLAQEVREIKAALPNFYYYIANHDKNPATGKTAHTTTRYPKRLYEDRVEGVSVAEWLKAAVINKQYRDVGSELI
ncbi:MAG: pectinacetylesterase family protein [Treponema sp.]|jgi:hypothetical protein|nr:pectinacetylesterase family protein [Treponema sp.]